MIRLKHLLEQTATQRVMSELEFITRVLAPRVAAELSETMERYLGGGSFGYAYLLQSGRVLKFTTDATEVAAATRIHRLGSLPHICGYYNIHPVRNAELKQHMQQRHENGEMYALLMDGVHVLSDAQREWWDCMQRAFFEDQSDEFVQQRTRDNVERWGYPTEGLDAFIQTMLSQRDSIRRSFRQRRINPAEAHGGNVGFNGAGQFMHFDPWMFRRRGQLSGYDGLEKTPVGLMRPIEIR